MNSRDQVVDYWWSQHGEPAVVTVEDTSEGRRAFMYSAKNVWELGGNPRFPQVAEIAAGIAVKAPPPTGMADIFDPTWGAPRP